MSYDWPVATPSPPLRLAYKLILPLTLVVAVVAGVSGMLRVSAVERGLRETMVVGADQLSRGITNATWHAMLADNRPAAYDVMQTIAREAGHQPHPDLQQGRADHVLDRPRGGRRSSTRTPRPASCATPATQPLVRVETPVAGPGLPRARTAHGASP